MPNNINFEYYDNQDLLKIIINLNKRIEILEKIVHHKYNKCEICNNETSNLYSCEQCECLHKPYGCCGWYKCECDDCLRSHTICEDCILQHKNQSSDYRRRAICGCSNEDNYIFLRGTGNTY
jgi:hypothetical protein